MAMNNKPLVSVVIPCYRQANYLPETLDSVIRQSYTNWEVMIVNDGSPDHTEEVANKYRKLDARIRYIYQENKGLSAARNKGIQEANGEFILPLDADDLIQPTYIEKAMKAFCCHPELKVVYSQGMFFGALNRLCKTQRWRGYKSLLARNPFFCSAFFRKDDCLAVGGYDEQMRKGFEDWEFFIRLLTEEDEVYQIPSPLFYYRIKEQSMLTQATQRDTAPLIEAYIYEKHKALYRHYFGGILSALGELDRLQERRVRQKNKWYRKLYHYLFK